MAAAAGIVSGPAVYAQAVRGIEIRGMAYHAAAHMIICGVAITVNMAGGTICSMKNRCGQVYQVTYSRATAGMADHAFIRLYIA